MAQQLREQGKDGPAKLADQAADRAQRVGSYLEDSDADRIIGDVEDFARRNPWAVALGGLALGFAASRVLRASSTDRYQSGAYGSRAADRGPAPSPGTAPYGAGTTFPSRRWPRRRRSAARWGLRGSDGHPAGSGACASSPSASC